MGCTNEAKWGRRCRCFGYNPHGANGAFVVSTTHKARCVPPKSPVSTMASMAEPRACGHRRRHFSAVLSGGRRTTPSFIASLCRAGDDALGSWPPIWHVSRQAVNPDHFGSHNNICPSVPILLARAMAG